MPRKVKAPSVRSDGVATAGSLVAPGGQPNGRPPRGAVTQAAAGAGAGGPMPYGQAGQLQADAANTPLPPGEAAYQAVTNHLKAVQSGPKKITPLFAPTERPFEHVTAGSPMSPGPTNPMAQTPASAMQSASVASILQQVAQASGSPSIAALANRAAATAAGGPSPSP